MLGVGSQTVLLCAHLVSLHRHDAESAQDPFARAIRAAQGIGLVLIMASGAAAVALHVGAGQVAILGEPAFAFKWVLIGLGLGLFLWQGRKPFATVLMGVTGGVWYALFILHSLGPVTTWDNLLILFGLWMLFFGLVWAGFAALCKGVHGAAHVPSSAMYKPAAPAFVQKPVVPLSVQKPAQQVAVASVPKPVPPPIAPMPIKPPPPPAPKPAPKPAPVVPPVVAKPVPPPPPLSKPPVPVPPVAPKLQKQEVKTVEIPTPKKAKDSWWHRFLVWFAKPVPAPAPQSPVVQPPSPVQPPLPPKPAPAPVRAVVAAPPMLPSAPVAPPPPPKPKPATPPTHPMTKPIVQKVEAPTLLEHDEPLLPKPQQGPLQQQERAPADSSLPGLRIMPQRPEDVGNEHRPAIIKP
jgi:hypothetical protein